MNNIFKSKQKQYVDKYNKMYYAKNKAKVIKHNNRKMFCMYCTSLVRKGYMSRHKKTTKHVLAKRLFDNMDDDLKLKFDALALAVLEVEERFEE